MGAGASVAQAHIRRFVCRIERDLSILAIDSSDYSVISVESSVQWDPSELPGFADTSESDRVSSVGYSESPSFDSECGAPSCDYDSITYVEDEYSTK